MWRSMLALVLLAPAAPVLAEEPVACSVSLEDRGRPPWFAKEVGATEAEARAKALAAACDGLAPQDRTACHAGAAAQSTAWAVERRRGQWSAELVVARPKTVIHAGAEGKTQELACKAALAAACKLAGGAPRTTDFGTPACEGTRWFCYGLGNGLLRAGPVYAAFE
jgi:hypothetical protein